MWSLAKPSPAFVARCVEVSRDAPLSYDCVGCTSRDIPAGYTLDQQRVKLGHGRADFETASAAIRGWEMFHLDWVEVSDTKLPIAVGATVAVVAKAGLAWSVNGCRIVEVFNELARFGFAYGTLATHVERGEERFLIEIDDRGDVWYDLRAMSRPAHWYVWLGYPVVRCFQAKFRRDSAAAMQRAMRT